MSRALLIFLAGFGLTSPLALGSEFMGRFFEDDAQQVEQRQQEQSHARAARRFLATLPHGERAYFEAADCAWVEGEAIVFRGFYRDRDVVFKLVSTAASNAGPQEIAVLRLLSPHRNILDLIHFVVGQPGFSLAIFANYYTTAADYFIPYELDRMGNLRGDVIREFESKAIAALNHLHSTGYAHGDVRLANFVRNIAGEWKMIGFGKAKKAGAAEFARDRSALKSAIESITQVSSSSGGTTSSGSAGTGNSAPADSGEMSDAEGDDVASRKRGDAGSVFSWLGISNLKQAAKAAWTEARAAYYRRQGLDADAVHNKRNFSEEGADEGATLHQDKGADLDMSQAVRRGSAF